MSDDDLRAAIDQIADAWAEQRAERQGRDSLDPSDFDRLAEAGFLLVGVPTEQGGLFESLPASTRLLCDVLRRLAAADPSVALVASMHPAVLGFWLASPDEPDEQWQAQRRWVAEQAREGAWWGTLTSEPGSGGDIARTRTGARPDEAPDPSTTPDAVGTRWRLGGDKHFGSGSGVTSFMFTSARPDGEEDPAAFFFDARNRAWDGSQGLTLTREWDGVGMQATQSHAFRLDDLPAVRLAWPRGLDDLVLASGPLNLMLFTAVVAGVVDAAHGEAKERLTPKAEEMRSYEQIEWARADLDVWTLRQAYEGGLRAVESGDGIAGLSGALRAKTVAAEAAEQALLRITRVVGGGSFSRSSPFSHWFEDVRALGFLRPPWALAFDNLQMVAWL